MQFLVQTDVTTTSEKLKQNSVIYLTDFGQYSFYLTTLCKLVVLQQLVVISERPVIAETSDFSEICSTELPTNTAAKVYRFVGLPVIYNVLQNHTRFIKFTHQIGKNNYPTMKKINLSFTKTINVFFYLLNLLTN